MRGTRFSLAFKFSASVKLQTTATWKTNFIWKNGHFLKIAKLTSRLKENYKTKSIFFKKSIFLICKITIQVHEYINPPHYQNAFKEKILLIGNGNENKKYERKQKNLCLNNVNG